MVLDKVGLLEELELKTERVTIGKGEVLVSELGAEDYIAIWTDPALKAVDGVDMAKFRPLLVARSVVNEEGERLFTDEEVAKLKRSNPARYNVLVEAAMRINGLSGGGAKNSEPSQSEDSSSVSA